MIQFIIAYFVVKAAVRNGNKEARERDKDASEVTDGDYTTTFKLLAVLGGLIVFTMFLV